MKHREKLYALGMILFLLGLLVGFALPAFHNPRMGLSAHLEGVMNGMFLILAGVIWDRIALPEKLLTWNFLLLLWAGYSNWFACVLAAVFGTSRMTPIAGAGFTASPWQEAVVSSLFASVGITMVLAVAMMVWGLVRVRST